MEPAVLSRREFHDLAELALNHESGGTTAWGNLGDWSTARTYPEACTALADRLGRALQLAPDSRLLDVGFGCGDQILRWREQFGVREIDGMNLSRSQTTYARERLAARGHADLAARLHCGDANTLGDWAAQRGPPAPDRVLALDCAYHFASRARFLDAAARLLPKDGRIGVTDLLLARQPLHPLREALPLRAITAASRIPRANLYVEAAYRSQWAQAGLHIECFEDLSAQVFLPFGAWLRRYRAGLGAATLASTNWTKFAAVARFLEWAAQRGVLRYVLCVARKA